MPEKETRKPAEILQEILAALQSNAPETRANAILQLHGIKYSSEAIRNELEKLALQDPDEDVRAEALYALDLATQKNVRTRFNKMLRKNREIVLREIEEWEKLGLVEKYNAQVIRRRYDFDVTSPIKPKPLTVKIEEPKEEAAPALLQEQQDDARQVEAPPVKIEEAKIEAAPPVQSVPPETTPAEMEVEEAAPVLPQEQPDDASKAEGPRTLTPVKPPQQQQTAAPRPTLLQTLLSETSIKIALYLGAFFVISSAAILAALYQVARLPILIIATLIFGGIAVAIRKRLPQPSFALFIVFSFLLPISANVLEESLSLSPPFSAAYWVFVSALMALIWGGSTWLYESRMFSLTAFLSLIVALYRIGDIFDSAPEFYTVMLGLAALAGLSGAWALKQWVDEKFARPLFLSAQLLQVVTLGGATIAFFVQFMETTSSTPLWNLAAIATYGFAFLFYVFSDFLYPFIFFRWLASMTLFAIPWLVGAAFKVEWFSGSIIFLVWGLILSAASEIANRFEKALKYDLPVLLVSILVFAFAVTFSFIDNVSIGFASALGVAAVYAALHLIRPRGWLWAVALLNFIVAYFAFFYLPFMEKVDIFFGYELLGLSLILLLPDLFLNNDLKENLAWRLPPRIYGAFFTTLSFVIYSVAGEKPLVNTAILFGIYAVFLSTYAWRYDKALIGYLATTALALSAIYLFNHLEWDIVLASLIILSALYFFGGFAFKKNESRAAWRVMLEASGLILGSIVALVALFMQKEYIGWFVLVVGILFVVQMYSRKQSLFEAGAHVTLCIAVYLILKDFRINEIYSVFMAFSLVILSLDMLFTRTYKAPRLLDLPVKMLGGILTVVASLIFFAEQNDLHTIIGFAIYMVFFAVYTFAQGKSFYGYLPAAYLPLTIFFALRYIEKDFWLPALTALAVVYFVVGILIRAKEVWSFMLRNSALALGAIVSLGALFTLKETGGWYVTVVGLLVIAEMYLRKQGLFEIGAHLLFPAALYLILRDFKLDNSIYVTLSFSLIWLGLDLIFSRTFKEKRPLEFIVKAAGTLAMLLASFTLPILKESAPAAIGFGIYAVFFAVYTAVQRKALYGYLPAAYLPLTIFFALDHFNVDAWLPTLTALSVIYFAVGILIRAKEAWSFMLRNSVLALGVIVSLGALFTLKETGGWYVAVVGLLVVAEMYLRQQSLFEIGAHLLFPAALYLILRDFKLDNYVYLLLGSSMIWLGLDLIFLRTFKEKRPLERVIKIAGSLTVLLASTALFMEKSSVAAVSFGIYAVFFAIYTAVQRKAIYGYLPAAYLPLTIFFALDHFNVDAWLPALTSLAVIYFVIGAIIRAREEWSQALRNSALVLGTLVSLGALFTLKETGGWYALVVGLLFAAEMYLSQGGLFELGLPVMFNIGAFLILHDFKINEVGYHLLAYSLVWLVTDLLAHRTFANPRPLKWIVRGIGAALALLNYVILFFDADAKVAAVGFGIYAILFLVTSLIYRHRNLLYAFTLTLPLFATYLFRVYDLDKWIHPVIVIAAIYYAIGYRFRMTKSALGWDAPLLFSGLGIGVAVSIAAPFIGSVDAAIPVALAATLWAAEAFARKNVWLGFPANGLYLFAYFIILYELDVNQPQFFSIGAALLGMIQHYLLTRTESKAGSFIMGMVSQFILLGTTYIQMVNTEQLGYFFVLFFQSLAVIVYGVVIRSRSLTFTPIGIVVISVITVLYSALKGISAVILIGCSGVILLMLGILAVVMRERITKMSEKLSDWKA